MPGRIATTGPTADASRSRSLAIIFTPMIMRPIAATDNCCRISGTSTCLASATRPGGNGRSKSRVDQHQFVSSFDRRSQHSVALEASCDRIARPCLGIIDVQPHPDATISSRSPSHQRRSDRRIAVPHVLIASSIWLGQSASARRQSKPARRRSTGSQFQPRCSSAADFDLAHARRREALDAVETVRGSSQPRAGRAS